MFERFRIEERETIGNSQIILTSSHSGGCEAVFSSPSTTQCCSHSDRVLSPNVDKNLRNIALESY